MRTNPRPTRAGISFYYPDNYGPYQAGSCTSNSRAHLLLRKIARRIFKFNVDILPDLPIGTMLEIGCASGVFLDRMARAGWRVEGIEPSAYAAALALKRGHSVAVGSLEDIPDTGVTYDLIVGWMVLEHLHDPGLALKKLRQRTKPGGYLVISVPNAGSFQFKAFRSKWYALQLPTHLFHYTSGTLTSLLESNGWQVERVFHQRLLGDVFASLGYVTKDLGYEGRLSKWLISMPEMKGVWHYLLFPFAWLASLFGQTARMTIWARRPND